MKRIKDAGHQMGNHMCEDRRSFKLSLEEYERRLMECDSVLESFGAFDNLEDPISCFNHGNAIVDGNYKWTRPGSGIFTSNMLDIAERNNYSTVLGNVYPWDPQIPSQWWSGRFVSTRASSGSIIIIHDRPFTPEALEYILQELSVKKQFQFLTLTELANYQSS